MGACETGLGCCCAVGIVVGAEGGVEVVVAVGTWEENSGSTAIGNDLATTAVGDG